MDRKHTKREAARAVSQAGNRKKKEGFMTERQRQRQRAEAEAETKVAVTF